MISFPSLSPMCLSERIRECKTRLFVTGAFSCAPDQPHLHWWAAPAARLQSVQHFKLQTANASLPGRHRRLCWAVRHRSCWTEWKNSGKPACVPDAETAPSSVTSLGRKTWFYSVFCHCCKLQFQCARIKMTNYELCSVILAECNVHFPQVPMTSLSLNSGSVKSINRHWFSSLNYSPAIMSTLGGLAHPFIIILQSCHFIENVSASRWLQELRSCRGCKKLGCFGRTVWNSLEEPISPQLAGGDWFEAAVTRSHSPLWPVSGLFAKVLHLPRCQRDATLLPQQQYIIVLLHSFLCA